MGEFEQSQHSRREPGPRPEAQYDDQRAPGRSSIAEPMQRRAVPAEKTLAMLGGDLAAADVRSQADEPAAAATQELDADAFTTGQAVFFGATRTTRTLAYAAKAPTINGGTTGVGASFEPLDRFRHALGLGDASTARATWATIAPAELLQLKTETDTLVRMLRVIGPDSIAMLHTIGVTPTANPRMVQVILHHGATTWVDALDAHGMLEEFLRARPRRQELDPGALASLAEYTRKDQPTAQAAFEKAYAPLRDGDFTSGGGTAHGVAWDQDHIRRAYLALQTGAIPASHLVGLNGIYIASHQTTGAAGRIPLGYGYFSRATKTIVMPLYAGDGAGVHKMVGSGTPEAPPMKHFTSTLLHEVGHHVGEQTGEHNWGTKPDSPLRMEPSTALEMRDELWDSTKTVELTEEGAEPVSEADAKLYLESESRGEEGSIYLITEWAKADNGARSRHLFLTNLEKQYREQPLYKMAKAVAGRPVNGYLHPMPGVKTPDVMFAYLTRYNAHSPWAKYSKAAFDHKPSWYAVSSAREWFAEHYTLYQTTGGAPLPAIQAKFKAIMNKLEAGIGPSGTAPSPVDSGAPTGRGSTDRSTIPASPAEGAQWADSGVAPVSESQIHRFEVQW